MTAAPPNERCERCGGDFRCGVADPGPCACSGLALTAALRAELRQRYRHCLCVACLRQLSAAGAVPAPAGPDAPRAAAPTR